MKDKTNPFLHNFIFFSLITLSVVTPLFLILIGTFLITEQSTEIIMKEIINFEAYLNPSPFNLFRLLLGLISLVLAVLVPIYAIKKGFGGLGWYISLIVNAVFLSILFIFLTTPLFDFLVMNIIFHKGFCSFLNNTLIYNQTKITDPSQQEYKEQAQKIGDDFCIAASKGFHFKYP